MKGGVRVFTDASGQKTHLLEKAKELNSTTEWNFLTWALTSTPHTAGAMLFSVIHSVSYSRHSWVCCYVNWCVERKKESKHLTH